MINVYESGEGLGDRLAKDYDLVFFVMRCASRAVQNDAEIALNIRISSP